MKTNISSMYTENYLKLFSYSPLLILLNKIASQIISIRDHDTESVDTPDYSSRPSTLANRTRVREKPPKSTTALISLLRKDLRNILVLSDEEINV